MALGFGMLGTGIGGFAAPIAANRLSTLMDWRQSYELLALIALVGGFLAHQMIFRNRIGSREDFRVAKTPGGSIALPEAGMSLGEALKTYRFWLIGLVVFLVSCSILGGFVHLAAFASDKGLGPDIAARAAGLVGLGLAISRVGVGFILDRVFAPLVGFVAFAFGAVGFFLLVSDLAAVPAYLLLAAILLGVSTGTEGDLIPYWTRKYFGKKALGAIYGTLFGVATLGAASGPYIYGLAFDHFKSYAQIHQISGLVCAACAVGILFLGKYPKDFAIKYGD
jgi:MFS family permease